MSDLLGFRDALGHRGAIDRKLIGLYVSFRRFCNLTDEPELRSEHFDKWIMTNPGAREYV